MSGSPPTCATCGHGVREHAPRADGSAPCGGYRTESREGYVRRERCRCRDYRSAGAPELPPGSCACVVHRGDQASEEHWHPMGGGFWGSRGCGVCGGWGYPLIVTIVAVRSAAGDDGSPLR